MSFVHPTMAAGAAGLVLLPLVIHLLSRRSYRREPWAAMRFLRAAQLRTRYHLRLEQWALLALRALIIALAVLTIARPFVAGSSLVSLFGQTRMDRVIILDDSFSMRARRGNGSTCFEAGKTAAAELLGGFGATDGIGLIGVSASGRGWMRDLVHDREAVKRILNEGSCSAEAGDLALALRSAADLLSNGQAAEGARTVYVVTDATRTLFDDFGSGPPQLPRDAPYPGIDRIHFIDVGGEERENLSIESLVATSQVSDLGVPVNFSLVVVNHCDRQRGPTEVALSLDGSAIRRLTVGPIAPRQKRSLEFELGFDRPGSHRLVARINALEPDPLAADDSRYFALRVAPRVRVLGVEGKGEAVRSSRDLFYYAIAVQPTGGEAGGSLIEFKQVSPAALDGEVLDDYAVVALGNVRRLSRGTWLRLERYVRMGGGLIAFLGDRVSAENYNRFAGRQASGLIPVELERAVALAANEERLHLRITDSRHLALADFAGSESGGLRLALVHGYWQVKQSPEDAGFRTLMRLSNDAPALLAHDLGEGRVVVGLIGANMGWTNLPAKPDYLPLMMNLTVYAAGTDRAQLNVPVGGRINLRVTSSEAKSPASVIRPDGRTVPVQCEPRGEAAAVSFADTNQEGTYSIQVGAERFDAAVNLGIQDSDLERVDAAAIQEWFGASAGWLAQRGLAAAEASASPPRELAQALTLLLLAAVAVETFFGAFFGRRR